NIDAAWLRQNRAAPRGTVKPTDGSPEAKEAIAESFAQEIEYQLTKPDGKQAIGWYDRQLRAAMDTVTEAYPEIGTDPDAEFVFKAMLAITSQGLPVEQNFDTALRAYHRFRDSGKIDMVGVSIPGAANNMIRDNVAKFAALVKDKGMDGAR